MPAAHVNLLQILLKLMDEESDNQDVLQGRTGPNVESGRAIGLLQSAARGVIGFKSLFTERAIQHSANIILGMIRDFMPESEWSKIVSKYPIQILRAIKDRAKSLEFDVEVQVVAGKGVSEEAEQNRALTLLASGLMSRQTAMEKMEINNIEQELQQISTDPVALAMVANQGSQPNPNGVNN